MNNSWYEKRKINQSHMLYEKLTKTLLNQQTNILKEMKGNDFVKRLKNAVDASSSVPVSKLKPSDFLRDLDAVINNNTNTIANITMAQKLKKLLDSEAKAQKWLDEHAQAIANKDASKVSKLFSQPETIIPELKSSGYIEPELLPEYPPKKAPVSPDVATTNVRQEMSQIDDSITRVTGTKGLTSLVDVENIGPSLEVASKEKSEPGFFQLLYSKVEKDIEVKKEKRIDEFASLMKGKAPIDIPFINTKRLELRGYYKQLGVFLTFVAIRLWLQETGKVTTDSKGAKVFIYTNAKGEQVTISYNITLDLIQYALNPLGGIAFGLYDIVGYTIPNLLDSIIGSIGSRDTVMVKQLREASDAEKSRPQGTSVSPAKQAFSVGDKVKYGDYGIYEIVSVNDSKKQAMITKDKKIKPFSADFEFLTKQ